MIEPHGVIRYRLGGKRAEFHRLAVLRPRLARGGRLGRGKKRGHTALVRLRRGAVTFRWTPLPRPPFRRRHMKSRERQFDRIYSRQR